MMDGVWAGMARQLKHDRGLKVQGAGRSWERQNGR